MDEQHYFYLKAILDFGQDSLERPFFEDKIIIKGVKRECAIEKLALYFSFV